jgi:hypothetical protein
VCGVLGGKQISGKKGRAMSGFEIGKKQQKHKYEYVCGSANSTPSASDTKINFFVFFLL